MRNSLAESPINSTNLAQANATAILNMEGVSECLSASLILSIREIRRRKTKKPRPQPSQEKKNEKRLAEKKENRRTPKGSGCKAHDRRKDYQPEGIVDDAKHHDHEVLWFIMAVEPDQEKQDNRPEVRDFLHERGIRDNAEETRSHQYPDECLAYHG